MEFAATIFERVVIMRRGEIIADGPPADVLTVASADLLASTGLTPPATARIAAALGIDPPPFAVEGLLDALVARGSVTLPVEPRTRQGPSSCAISPFAFIVRGFGRASAPPDDEEQERGLDHVDPGDDRRDDEGQRMPEWPSRRRP